MMAPIPDSSLEKWSATLDAVCTDKTFEPRKPTYKNPIAAFDMQYPCTPLEVLQHQEDGQPPYFFGGFLQFDEDEKLSRIELEMFTSEQRGVDAIQRVFVRYGLPIELVTKKFPKGRMHDGDIFEYDS